MLALDLNRVVRDEYLQSRNATFPFKTSVSLKPLVDYWKDQAKENSPNGQMALSLLKEVSKYPELLLPNPSAQLLESCTGLINHLMSPIFPSAFRQTDCTAVVMPFSLFPFYVTENFNSTFMTDTGHFAFDPGSGHQEVDKERAFSGYVSVAARIYGFVVRRPRQRIIYTIPDRKTGLLKYYDFFISTKFIEIQTHGNIPTLDEPKKKYLQQNLRSLEAWMKTLPVEHFEFSGFSFVRAIDVTMQEVTTSIKQILIDKDSIASENSFRALEENVCTLLQRKGLELRLTIFLGRNAVRYSLLRNLPSDGLVEDYLSEKRASGLKKFAEEVTQDIEIGVLNKEEISAKRMELDLRWLNSSVEFEVLAPLRYQGTLIGFLELGSDKPIDANEYQLSVLNNILPLVSVAAKRSFDELQFSVQNIIRERCTAIHPSIEWRFEKAAFQLVSTHTRHQPMETIEFKNVFPLFAFTDICASTSLRNAAIRKDLMEELAFLRETLEIAQKISPMPMIDLFLFRVENWLRQLELELSAGDDLSIESALSSEIMPFINDLRSLHPAFSKELSEIEAKKQSGMSVTSARETFEDSLLTLTNILSHQLDDEEKKAQDLCSHYYEKRVTDGVEHSIYIGNSISEKNHFSRTSLKNLRMWQLITAIELEKVSQRTKPMLKIPLDTAHCIVVQDTPLDIHFKYDEKRFGVAGLANIRFEIIKKRVEKALVNDRGERLTLGGHLAIVYSQERERVEYQQYLQYLSHMKLIHPNIEDLELRNTQELRGLKALRVRIKVDPPSEK